MLRTLKSFPTFVVLVFHYTMSTTWIGMQEYSKTNSEVLKNAIYVV